MQKLQGCSTCPVCSHSSLVLTSAMIGLWECLNPDCACYVDMDGDIYERNTAQKEVN